MINAVKHLLPLVALLATQLAGAHEVGPPGFLGERLGRIDNAINAEMIEEVHHAFDQIELNDAVHAVVVHGNGRAFCSGFDV